THPSEPNYVAVLGGNSFGIAGDNPYYMNSVTKPGRQRFRHLMSGPSASSRDRAASSRRWWSTGTAPDGPSYPARTQAAPGTTSTASKPSDRTTYGRLVSSSVPAARTRH